MICSLLNRFLLIGSALSKDAELQFSTVLLQGGQATSVYASPSRNHRLTFLTAAKRQVCKSEFRAQHANLLSCIPVSS
jgi:hypothetical protein